MRLMSQAATVVVIAATLLYHGALFVPDDDTEIIRQYTEFGWARGRLSPEQQQPLLDWAQWCKAGLQLGEFEICPAR